MWQLSVSQKWEKPLKRRGIASRQQNKSLLKEKFTKRMKWNIKTQRNNSLIKWKYIQKVCNYLGLATKWQSSPFTFTFWNCQSLFQCQKMLPQVSVTWNTEKLIKSTCSANSTHKASKKQKKYRNFCCWNASRMLVIRKRKVGSLKLVGKSKSFNQETPAQEVSKKIRNLFKNFWKWFLFILFWHLQITMDSFLCFLILAKYKWFILIFCTCKLQIANGFYTFFYTCKS